MATRSFRNNVYTHTLSIVVYVRTARLWESPANYLRKHLGLSNYWTRSNGTVVRLSRIILQVIKFTSVFPPTQVVILIVIKDTNILKVKNSPQ